MPFVYALISLGVLFVAAYLTVRVKKAGVYAVFLKSGASLCFLSLTMLSMYLMKAPVYGYCILLGQIFGLLGDIFLDLKFVHAGQSEPYTHMGFAAFGFGHLLFFAGLAATFSFAWPHIAVAALAALVFTVLIYFSKVPMKLNYERFSIDTIVYAYISAFILVITALQLILNHGYSTTLACFVTGMSLFLLSDLILSQIYFCAGKNKPRYIITNAVLYYAAQFMISASILFL
jgi:hypothetical protein